MPLSFDIWSRCAKEVANQKVVAKPRGCRTNGLSNQWLSEYWDVPGQNVEI